MTYRVVLEHRSGRVEMLGQFETRKAAMLRINQHRIDDEGHDEYWRLWIEDDGRLIYEHRSTHYLIDRLSESERRSGRVLMPDG
ncbi:MAG: hypothetical protein WBP94_00950 [Rhodomicrobiaceae bacterium]